IQVRHIVRRTDLRRHSEDADIVVQYVVGQAEARAYRGSTAASGRVSDAYARSPVSFWGLWLVEQQRLLHGSADDDARSIGDRVQRLVRLASGDRGVFVTNSQI